MGVGTVGDTFIDELLAEYAVVAEIPLEDATIDEQKVLLYAVLLELRAARLEPNSPDIEVALDERTDGRASLSGPYRSESDAVKEKQNTDTSDPTYDLNFRTSEVDLRFDDDVVVSFGNFSDPSNRIEYGASKSPVVGIPVSTSDVWVVAQGGTGGANVDVDMWS